MGTLLLIAAGIRPSANVRPAPADYIPGVVILALWIYYVQRPKTAMQMRWNWLYLVELNRFAVS
jgi:hypothetical protein